MSKLSAYNTTNEEIESLPDRQIAIEVKSTLLHVVELMNIAATCGIKIEFTIAFDAQGNVILQTFNAFQRMKLDH